MKIKNLVNVLLVTSLLTSEFLMADCSTNRNADIVITKPDSIYTDNGDGTITDTDTGLMWQKCPLGLTGLDCLSGAKQVFTWQAALSVANDNTDYGYNNWRLPNKNELASLAEPACYSPAINETIFPNTSGVFVSDYYWSSSGYALTASEAFALTLSDGSMANLAKNTEGHVRLVRDSS